MKNVKHIVTLSVILSGFFFLFIMVSNIYSRPVYTGREQSSITKKPGCDGLQCYDDSDCGKKCNCILPRATNDPKKQKKKSEKKAEKKEEKPIGKCVAK